MAHLCMHLLSRPLHFAHAIQQPYPLALALLSIFAIFIIELIAFRWGTSKLAAIDMTHGEHSSF